MRQYVLNLKKYDDDDNDNAKERKWHCMKCMNSQGYGLNFIITILDMNNFIITMFFEMFFVISHNRYYSRKDTRLLIVLSYYSMNMC